MQRVLVSVIIPTLNRSRQLNRTLFSLCEQVTQHDFEIIVVDNGSSDKTRQIVENYSGITDRLVYIFDDRPGLLVGRNVGAQNANGDILSFIDDDVIIPPHWINGVINVFKNNDYVHLATGNNYPFFESTPPEWLDHMWRRHGPAGKYLYELSLLNLGCKGSAIDPVFVWGLNYHIRKWVYFDVGGFNPDILSSDYIYFIGDGETGIADKIAKRNYKAFFNPELSLHHTVTSERLTKEYFLRRSYTEGMMHAYSDIRNATVAEDNATSWAFTRWPIRAARKAFQCVERKKKRIKNNELCQFQDAIKTSLTKGYEDYVKNVEGNSLLMEYVREDNYLDIDKIATKYYYRTKL